MAESAKNTLTVLIFSAFVAVSQCQMGGTITYRLPEEGTVGEMFGSIITDANLDTKYSSQVLQTLQFRFLTKPEISITVGQDSGFLATDGRIDREDIPGCQRDEVCRVSIDVTVQPSSYFQIIKVVIDIVDVNDNKPEFDQNVFEYTMKESTPTGSMFVVPSALDIDSPAFGIQKYQLKSKEEGRKQVFALRVIPNPDGSKRVKIELVRRLDRETTDRYAMVLEALDGGSPPLTAELEIVINVLDSNDNHPVFNQTSYEIIIPEDVTPHSAVFQVQAVDKDIGENGKVEYSFSPQSLSDFGHVFGIDSQTGEIYPLVTLDHEQLDIYNMIVTAQDLGPDSQPADVNVVIHVEDVNDNAPTIIVNTLTASGTNYAEIPEDSPKGSFVAHLTVTDADSGMNGDFTCKLNEDAFALKPTEYRTEYQILTSVPLDREKEDQYNLALHCDDFGEPPQKAIQHIEVAITDVNDHPPIFSELSYLASIIENNFLEAHVLRINATDADTGPNANIEYTLSENVRDVFGIEQQTGIIFAKTVIDREKTSQFRFLVIAADQGKPAYSSTASVVVMVEDVNDERPIFTGISYTFRVDENREPGAVVGSVTATDNDAAPYNQFSYSFIEGTSSAGPFMIDPKSGRVMTRESLDREVQPIHHMVIAARDTHAPTRFSSTASVTVIVDDLNDNSPLFQFPTPFNHTVHMSNKVPVGYNLTRISATDPDKDENGRIAYTIQSGNSDDLYSIDEDSGIISTNVDLSVVDYKLTRLQILATDHGDPDPRNNFVDLVIVVNKSIPYLPPGAVHFGFLSTQNLLIIISVACGCVIVVLILIIAIVCIRRQDKVRRTQRYNCRMEAIGRLNAKEVLKNDQEKPPVKDQSIPLPVPDGDGTLKAKERYVSDTRGERLGSPSPKLLKKKLEIQAPGPLHHHPHHPHHWEMDQLSIHSEGSVTDSGRGPSEEGDCGGGPKHDRSSMSPGHRSTHSSLGQYSTPPYYYPHLKAHAAAHSYSTLPTQKLRSFAPEDEENLVATPNDRRYETLHAVEPGAKPYLRPAPQGGLPAHGNGYTNRPEINNGYPHHPDGFPKNANPSDGRFMDSRVTLNTPKPGIPL